MKKERFYDELNNFFYYKFNTISEYYSFIKQLNIILRLKNRDKKLSVEYMMNLYVEAGFKLINRKERYYPNRYKHKINS